MVGTPRNVERRTADWKKPSERRAEADRRPQHLELGVNTFGATAEYWKKPERAPHQEFHAVNPVVEIHAQSHYGGKKGSLVRENQNNIVRSVESDGSVAIGIVTGHGIKKVSGSETNGHMMAEGIGVIVANNISAVGNNLESVFNLADANPNAPEDAEYSASLVRISADGNISYAERQQLPEQVSVYVFIRGRLQTLRNLIDPGEELQLERGDLILSDNGGVVFDMLSASDIERIIMEAHGDTRVIQENLMAEALKRNQDQQRGSLALSVMEVRLDSDLPEPPPDPGPVLSSFEEARQDKLAQHGFTEEDLPKEYKDELDRLDDTIGTAADNLRKLRLEYIHLQKELERGRVEVADVEAKRDEYSAERTQFVKEKIQLALAERLSVLDEIAEREIIDHPLRETIKGVWKRLGDMNAGALYERARGSRPDSKLVNAALNMMSMRTATSIALATGASTLGAIAVAGSAPVTVAASLGAGAAVLARSGMTYIGFDGLVQQKQIASAEAALAKGAWPDEHSSEGDWQRFGEAIVHFEARSSIQGSKINSLLYHNASRHYMKYKRQEILNGPDAMDLEQKLGLLFAELDDKLFTVRQDLQERRKIQKIITGAIAAAFGSGFIWDAAGGASDMFGETTVGHRVFETLSEVKNSIYAFFGGASDLVTSATESGADSAAVMGVPDTSDSLPTPEPTSAPVVEATPSPEPLPAPAPTSVSPELATPESTSAAASPIPVEPTPSATPAEPVAEAVSAEVADIPDAVWTEMTVAKGEGFWQSLRPQVMENAETLGYTEGMGSKATWANRFLVDLMHNTEMPVAGAADAQPIINAATGAQLWIDKADAVVPVLSVSDGSATIQLFDTATRTILQGNDLAQELQLHAAGGELVASTASGSSVEVAATSFSPGVIDVGTASDMGLEVTDVPSTFQEFWAVHSDEYLGMAQDGWHAIGSHSGDFTTGAIGHLGDEMSVYGSTSFIEDSTLAEASAIAYQDWLALQASAAVVPENAGIVAVDEVIGAGPGAVDVESAGMARVDSATVDASDSVMGDGGPEDIVVADELDLDAQSALEDPEVIQSVVNDLEKTLAFHESDNGMGPRAALRAIKKALRSAKPPIIEAYGITFESGPAGQLIARAVSDNALATTNVDRFFMDAFADTVPAGNGDFEVGADEWRAISQIAGKERLGS